MQMSTVRIRRKTRIMPQQSDLFTGQPQQPHLNMHLSWTITGPGGIRVHGSTGESVIPISQFPQAVEQKVHDIPQRVMQDVVNKIQQQTQQTGQSGQTGQGGNSQQQYQNAVQQLQQGLQNIGRRTQSAGVGI